MTVGFDLFKLFTGPFWVSEPLFNLKHFPKSIIDTTQALGSEITPYQVLFGKKPNVSWLKEFSTRCWVMVLDQHHSKLDPKAKEHLFVGIAEHAKAWKCFNKVSKHVQISRNMTFDLNDTRLFPIPNEDDDNEPIVPLKGETQPHKWATEPVPIDPITPQTSAAPTPNPSAKILDPDICWST